LKANSAGTSTQKPNFMFGFFYRYLFSIILSIILISLIYRNFIINHFPFSLQQKQKNLQVALEINQSLSQKNKQFKTQLAPESDFRLENAQSLARFKFRFIKPEETYYQIIRNTKK
jgi:cell division protein FtsB